MNTNNKLTEEQIIEAFEILDDTEVINIKYVEDKYFWAVDINAQYGFSVQDLINVCGELGLDPDYVFIDKDITHHFRISIFVADED